MHISIIVEGFEKKERGYHKIFISTKAADAIASGSNIFLHGSKECGVIEYNGKYRMLNGM